MFHESEYDSSLIPLQTNSRNLIQDTWAIFNFIIAVEFCMTGIIKEIAWICEIQDICIAVNTTLSEFPKIISLRVHKINWQREGAVENFCTRQTSGTRKILAEEKSARKSADTQTLRVHSSPAPRPIRREFNFHRYVTIDVSNSRDRFRRAECWIKYRVSFSPVAPRVLLHSVFPTISHPFVERPWIARISYVRDTYKVQDVLSPISSSFLKLVRRSRCPEHIRIKRKRFT